MRHRRAAIRACIPILAVLLSLALATDALALTWGTSVRITTSRNGVVADHGLATTGGPTAHLVYDDAKGGIRRVWYRRSTNGGVSWGTPVQLSTTGAVYAEGGSASALGSKVDTAWLEEQAAGNWVVKYRRSTNGGGAWSGVLSLSPATADANHVRLVRDSANRVFVTWTDSKTGSIRLRRSLDGGLTWAGATSLGTTTLKPFSGSASSLLEGWSVVAAGSGVVYAAFHKTATTLVIRRTTNGGATWTTTTTLTTKASGNPADLAATGSVAIVAYDAWISPNQYVVIQKTTDKGAHWGPPAPVSPATGNPELSPQLAYHAATWRLVYIASGDATYTKGAVHYRQSADSGKTWSTPQKVSTTARPYSIPGGVGYTGKAIVCWFDWKPDVLDSDVYVRLGS